MPVLVPTVAIADASDVQIVLVVISSVVLSEKVPMALRLVLAPLASVAGDGVTAILLKMAGVTAMSTLGELMLFEDA